MSQNEAAAHTRPINFPSEAFPAYPGLTVHAPEQWVALAAVGLPLALAREVPSGQFRPNILVTITRFGVDFSFDQARKLLDAKLKKLPRYKETERVAEPFLTGEGMHLVGRFTAAKGEIIRQRVSIAVINRGYVFDVVEITATSALVSGDNVEAEITEILASLSVTL